MKCIHYCCDGVTASFDKQHASHFRAVLSLDNN